MNVRQNYAEGKFYSSSRQEVVALIEQALSHEKGSILYSLAGNQIVGGVVPHAGHIFCAREAVHFFEIVRQSGQEFDTVVIINPNHTGMGAPMSVDVHDAWQTSLGTIALDHELARALELPFNGEAQRYEHSAEVIVPFVQHFLPKGIKILPINILHQGYRPATQLAHTLRRASELLGRRLLVVASSDFSHFKQPEVGYELDSYALEPLLKFDMVEFERRIRERDISICGYAPIISLLCYAQLAVDRPTVRVLCRGNSGEVHPSKSVVNYVSMLVYSG